MSDCVLRFNGERLDPVSGTTHLGNGYRAYNRMLMKFNSPDTLSPFGAGGINSYAYCTGDPVNLADHSGHHSLYNWVGIGIGMALGALLTPISGGTSLAVALSTVSVTTEVVSIGLAVGQQFLEESDPKAAAALGWAALGTGIVSVLSSATLAKLVPGAKSLGGLLNGTSNRPFGGLMLTGSETGEAALVPETSLVQRGLTSTHRPILSAGLQTRRVTYEREAYEVARPMLNLPARRNHGIMLLPEFGLHRRLLQNSSIPVYSQELQELAPLSDIFECELNHLYDQIGLENGARNFRVSGESRSRYLLSQRQNLTGTPRQFSANMQPPPPRYSTEDLAPISSYEQSQHDELLDYHFMTHL